MNEEIASDALKPQMFQNTLDIQRLSSICEALHKDVEKLTKSVDQLLTDHNSKEIMLLKIEARFEDVKSFKDDITDMLETVGLLKEDRDRREKARQRWFSFILPILVPCVTLLAFTTDYIYFLKHKV